MARIEEEKRTVELMIRLYCRHHEGKDSLCRECQEMLDYAWQRLDRCKFGERKGTCKQCPVHCYRPDMRQRIAKVMRWAGPRMLIYHPMMAMRHLWRECR